MKQQGWEGILKENVRNLKVFEEAAPRAQRKLRTMLLKAREKGPLLHRTKKFSPGFGEQMQTILRVPCLNS